nr:hypothetical protein [Tanacetum cinerariifolium]
TVTHYLCHIIIFEFNRAKKFLYKVDELRAMASEHSSSGPTLNEMTPVTISSGLVQKSYSSTPFVPPSRNDWDLQFQPMFDELLNPPPSVVHQAPKVIAPIDDVIPPVQDDSTGSPSSTTVDQDAPSVINLIQQQKYNPQLFHKRLASESALAEEPMQTTSQMEEPSHPKFDTSADDQPIVQSSLHPEWFSQPQKPPTPDHDWNKTLPVIHGSIQPVDTLTPELLVGPTYDLMKGSCKSLIELEYHLEEVYKATIDQLDWVNPEGQQYPHNLLQPQPLIPDNRELKIMEWHIYKHLDWITVRRDDDKLYNLHSLSCLVKDVSCINI